MDQFGLDLVWARGRPDWLEDRESLLVSVLISASGSRNMTLLAIGVKKIGLKDQDLKDTCAAS